MGIPMSNLLVALLLGGYGFLVLPAIVLLVMTLFDHSRDPEQPTRGRLLMFLVLTAFVLALLGLLIWFNPSGREISSSIPAVGVLIVLIALLVYLLGCWRVLASLWATEKALVTSFALVYLSLFIFLFLGDPVALLLVVVPTLAFTFILHLSRAGVIVLTILSLLILAVIIFTAGGWIYIPTANQPAWSQTARSILMGIALLISILLPAGLLYMSLRISPDGKKPPLVWTLVLTVILLAGVVYQSFWEGIWSSAHARAFEDHLPVFQFLLSLVAGLLLALILRGYRKWTGPIYTVLVTAVAVAAFAHGWNVSAFDMTERRAAVVDQAISTYYRDHGIYPDRLAELTPRYLPFLPPPVVVRLGGWCYQSSGNAYRLGYISGDFGYFDSTFKVETYARDGNVPAEIWACDDLRARFDAKEFVY
jgi:hypothetical protein